MQRSCHTELPWIHTDPVNLVKLFGIYSAHGDNSSACFFYLVLPTHLAERLQEYTLVSCRLFDRRLGHYPFLSGDWYQLVYACHHVDGDRQRHTDFNRTRNRHPVPTDDYSYRI